MIGQLIAAAIVSGRFWSGPADSPSASPSSAPSPGVSPSTSGDGAGGFDWNRIHPDPAAVPKAGLFYTMLNACMFLGVVAAVGGFVAGSIAFGVGPIFGAHIISDRGKSMMWKAGLVSIATGSATTVVAFLLKQ